MTLWHLPWVVALTRGFRRGARDLFQRAALTAAAGVIGVVGSCFVVYAAFGALRLLIGPELAALGIGVVLLTVAGILARDAKGVRSATQPGAALPPDAPSPPIDPTTLAIFTAAFVLGRHLADRGRD